MPVPLLQAHPAEVSTHWSLIAVPLHNVSLLLALQSAMCQVGLTILDRLLALAHLIHEIPSAANVYPLVH